MRRQSLRPRQIDVHARMRVIRSEEDLVLDEDGTGSSQPQATFEELVGVRSCVCVREREFFMNEPLIE